MDPTLNHSLLGLVLEHPHIQQVQEVVEHSDIEVVGLWLDDLVLEQSSDEVVDYIVVVEFDLCCVPVLHQHFPAIPCLQVLLSMIHEQLDT